MVPGWAGTVLTVTLSVWVLDVPQVLLAETEMVPLEPDAVVEMLLLVLVPVQPPGRVQV